MNEMNALGKSFKSIILTNANIIAFLIVFDITTIELQAIDLDFWQKILLFRTKTACFVL